MLSQSQVLGRTQLVLPKKWTLREQFDTHFSLLDIRAVCSSKLYVFADKGLVLDFYMCSSEWNIRETQSEK